MRSNISNPFSISNHTNTTDQDYAIGGVVVYVDEINIQSLETIEEYCLNDHYWLVGAQLVHVSHIRPATTAELKAKRRLSETEQSLAEVS